VAAAAACALAAPLTVGGPAQVDPTSTTQGFLGLATSMSTIPGLSGSASNPDVPFDNLVRSLSPGAPPLLRLGGNSGDDSWWPVPGVQERTLKYLYKLTPAWAARVQAMLKRLGGTALLGVDLEEPPSVATTIAKAEVENFEKDIGPKLIDAFELGNEPEYFPGSLISGGTVKGKDTIPAYGTAFSSVAAALGGAPIAGPGSVGKIWVHSLGTILGRLPRRLKLATVHAYALKNCSSLAHLSLSDFFASESIEGLADAIHHTVEAAAAHGKPLRVDEINGITCGGKAGMSDTFGEALWALNVLPALWRAGVQGVNVQSVDGGHNQVIVAHHTGTHWRLTVEPEIYGLLAFAQTTPAGSRLLTISKPAGTNFFQYAVRAPDGSERVVLTNVGTAARTVAVAASGARGAGTVSLLTARSLSATGDVTLSGEHLSTRTGQLTGTPHQAPVTPDAAGAYRVTVPAHSAAILTVQR
jgi:hypothetical protein